MVDGLQRNVDLEHGLFSIEIALGVKTSETNSVNISYYLQVAVLTSGAQTSIIPRNIMINSFKPYVASTKAPIKYLDGVTIQSCVFDLSNDDFNYFKDVPISHMSVTDPVAGSNFDFYVNSKIIANQAACILKLVKSN